jgi:hypothetical protein
MRPQWELRRGNCAPWGCVDARAAGKGAIARRGQARHTSVRALRGGERSPVGIAPACGAALFAVPGSRVPALNPRGCVLSAALAVHPLRELGAVAKVRDFT